MSLSFCLGDFAMHLLKSRCNLPSLVSNPVVIIKPKKREKKNSKAWLACIILINSQWFMVIISFFSKHIFYNLFKFFHSLKLGKWTWVFTIYLYAFLETGTFVSFPSLVLPTFFMSSQRILTITLRSYLRVTSIPRRQFSWVLKTWIHLKWMILLLSPNLKI